MFLEVLRDEYGCDMLMLGKWHIGYKDEGLLPFNCALRRRREAGSSAASARIRKSGESGDGRHKRLRDHH